jgi:hypothetical protein
MFELKFSFAKYRRKKHGKKLTLVVVVEGASVVVVVGSVRGFKVVVVEVGACDAK